MKQAELRATRNSDISAEQVRSYLAANPDFFVQHQDLLKILSVPHPSGSAVSLVEKQIAILREQNKGLKDEFENLKVNARKNEQLFDHMHKLTLVLMEANDLEGAIASFQSVLYEQFKADFVSLRIIQDNQNSALAGLFVPVQDRRLKSFRKILKSGRPECGRPNAEYAALLFGENAEQVRSCAIVPFFVSDTVGLLGIGSYDKARFVPGMGHLFLSRIGELIGYRLGTLLENPN